jgi:hypothetical protein
MQDVQMYDLQREDVHEGRCASVECADARCEYVRRADI